LFFVFVLFCLACFVFISKIQKYLENEVVPELSIEITPPCRVVAVLFEKEQLSKLNVNGVAITFIRPPAVFEHL
jgi:hypothetical protein